MSFLGPGLWESWGLASRLIQGGRDRKRAPWIAVGYHGDARIQPSIFCTLLQLTGLLKTSQRSHHWIECVKQNQNAVLMQIAIAIAIAIARPIAFATDVMQLLQQHAQLTEILQPDDVFLVELSVGCLRHARSLAEVNQNRTLRLL